MTTTTATRFVPVALTCVRTKMCGGGTSYDVYVSTEQKEYRPITGHIYATVIVRNGREFFDVDDFLRTPEIDALPALTSERIEAFTRLRAIAGRIAFRAACRVYPELRPLHRLPALWAGWDKPHATREVTICLPECVTR